MAEKARISKNLEFWLKFFSKYLQKCPNLQKIITKGSKPVMCSSGEIYSNIKPKRKCLMIF